MFSLQICRMNGYVEEWLSLIDGYKNEHEALKDYLIIPSHRRSFYRVFEKNTGKVVFGEIQ